jgi:hypothetical protein
MRDMAGIRRFEEQDLPGVARLFTRVYPDAGWPSHADLQAYFREVFFGNPWVDPALPSWVAEEPAGIVGFIGVVPRTMRHNGRAVRAAVVTQLMTDSDKRHGVAAARLLRKALNGPQELMISDGANESSRRMWEALGGSTSTLYGLQWQRALRPAQWALQMLAQRGLNAVSLVAAPVAALADAYLAGRAGLGRRVTLREEPLGTDALLAAFDELAAGAALKPQYDPRSLGWLLGQAGAKRRHGELQSTLLRGTDGQVAGWFLYYLSAGTSRVLQLHARKGSEAAVLESLLHHAWRRGAAAIEGRMEPRFARALSERHCFFRGRGVHALVHARNPALLAALECGEAFFSRLEGELWMRFTGEPPAPAPERLASADLLSRLRWFWPRARAQAATP